MTRASSSRTRHRRGADQGASAVEYALIIAGAGLAMIGGVVVMSGGLQTAYQASAQGAEAGVTLDQEAAGSTGQAAVPEVTATPSPSVVPTVTATPTPTPTPSATKTSATPTPTPTRPKDAIGVGSGDEAAAVDIGVSSGARGFTATVDPAAAGAAYLDQNNNLVFDASSKASSGTLVTVSWSYSKGGKLYSGTTTYWIT